MSNYLDYNASTPIDVRVLDTMIDAYKNYYGNADSRTHTYGDNARKVVEDSRKKIASLLNVKPDEVFFTSGATESNNLAVLGLKEYAMKAGKKHIITTSIEHKAILESVKSLEKDGFQIDFINPSTDGRIKVEDIVSKVKEDTLLVSVMHVNNETGIIQPVKEIGDFLSDKNVLFHIDATQSCGKLIKEIQDLKYDMMSISAHKMFGPQGIGALILRKKRYKLPPVKAIMYGGPQEKGLRPGTLPTALIVGFGKAAELALEEYEINNQNCNKLKMIFLDLLKNSGLKYEINGDQEFSVSNTLNVAFPGVSSEALMLLVKNACSISNGSACNSNSYSLSHVLTSMGLSQEVISSSIRISWGKFTDVEEFRADIIKLLNIVKSLV